MYHYHYHFLITGRRDWGLCLLPHLSRRLDARPHRDYPGAERASRPGKCVSRPDRYSVRATSPLLSSPPKSLYETFVFIPLHRSSKQPVPYLIILHRTIEHPTTHNPTNRVFVAFKATEAHLARALGAAAAAKKCRVVGNPIRSSLVTVADAARRERRTGACETSAAHASCSVPRLLVLGGSLGAQAINQCV